MYVVNGNSARRPYVCSRNTYIRYVHTVDGNNNPARILIYHGRHTKWYLLVCFCPRPIRPPPSTQVVSPSLSVDDGGVSATGLFRKRYDAYPSENALGGTCMEGQLLDEGYAQEQANGR